MDNLEKFLIQNEVLFKFSNSNKKYHPVLTSGLHSDSYFNSIKLFESTSLTQMIMKHIFDDFYLLDNISSMCSSIGGLLTLGSHFACVLTETFNSFRSKQRIVFNKKNAPELTYWNYEDIKQPLMLVDDVITTGGSLKYIINNIINKIELSKYIIVIANRYGDNNIEICGKEFEIISAYEFKSKTWKSNNCPLCNKYNSKPLRPKGNWNMFFS